MFLVGIVLCSNIAAIKISSEKKFLAKLTVGNENLIQNGDFEDIDKSQFDADGIGQFTQLNGGWFHTVSYLEAGYGKSFIPHWEDDNIVVHLDDRGNVFQEVNLTQDSECRIKFRFAGYIDVATEFYTFIKVYFNGEKVLEHDSVDDVIHHVNVKVQGVKGINRIEFGGTSFDRHKGISFDDVEFTCKDAGIVPEESSSEPDDECP